MRSTPLGFEWIHMVACSLDLTFGLHGGTSSFRLDPDYLIDVWEIEDGLPDNSATTMVQTSSGYLWFGTWRGLIRFDGVKFTLFNRKNTPQLTRMSGLELCQGRVAFGDQIPVIVITAFDSEDTRRQAKEAGSAHYFSKSAPGQKVIESIRRLSSTNDSPSSKGTEDGSTTNERQNRNKTGAPPPS